MQPDTAIAPDAAAHLGLGDVVETAAGYDGRSHAERGFWLAVAFLVLICVVALAADLLPLADPLQPDPSNARVGPSRAHWMGSDGIGRDLLSRIIYGARVSLVVAAVSAALAGLIGGAIGVVAGYYRGRHETWLMGAMNVMLSFPALVFALALTAFLGASLRNIILTIGVLGIPVVARITRAQTLSFSTREFVTASRAMGAKHGRIMVREVTPNVVPALFAFALVLAAVAILIEGSLSFLGLGVPPPAPAWGAIIAAGQPDLARAPHITLFPSAVMFLTVLSFHTVGERLRARHADGGAAL